jgi:hypothetical protein
VSEWIADSALALSQPQLQYLGMYSLDPYTIRKERAMKPYSRARLVFLPLASVVEKIVGGLQAVTRTTQLLSFA